MIVIGIVIGVAVGGVLMVALYELFILPALVRRWGPWPIEAQRDMYERGYQAGAARARAALEDNT